MKLEEEEEEEQVIDYEGVKYSASRLLNIVMLCYSFMSCWVNGVRRYFSSFVYI